MSSKTRKLASLAATVLTASGLALFGAGSANAAQTRSCHSNVPGTFRFNQGPLHVSEGFGDCSWIQPGGAARGIGTHNHIYLGNIQLPNGQQFVGFLDDPTGLYPTN